MSGVRGQRHHHMLPRPGARHSAEARGTDGLLRQTTCQAVSTTLNIVYQPTTTTAPHLCSLLGSCYRPRLSRHTFTRSHDYHFDLPAYTSPWVQTFVARLCLVSPAALAWLPLRAHELGTSMNGAPGDRWLSVMKMNHTLTNPMQPTITAPD